MATVNANSSMINVNCYRNCTTLVNVDLANVPFVGNSAANVFNGCTNLKSVTNINPNVERMFGTFAYCNSMVDAPTIPDSVSQMASTFRNCKSLINGPAQLPSSVTNLSATFINCTNMINGPTTIPSGVTNMNGTFYMCSKLVNAPDSIPNGVTSLINTFYWCGKLIKAPTIPNSVTDMTSTFTSCSNLVNPPAIPNGVVNMANTFYGCWNIKFTNIPASVNSMYRTYMHATNVTGDLYIESENITNATLCFYSTNNSLRKNVHIPFKYENGTYTKTYNAFTEAGYDTSGSLDGVYLKDTGGSGPVPTEVSTLITLDSTAATKQYGKSTDDGYNWTEMSNLPSAKKWNNILYVNNVYYLFPQELAQGSSYSYYTSTNLSTWTTHTLANPNLDDDYTVHGVVFNPKNSTWIIYGQCGMVDDNTYFTMIGENPTTWTKHVMSYGIGRVSVTKDKFFMSINPSDTYFSTKGVENLQYSEDGITWTTCKYIGTAIKGYRFSNVVYGNGKYMVAFGGDKGTSSWSASYETGSFSSSDLINWTQDNYSLGVIVPSLGFFGGKFIVYGKNASEYDIYGQILTSDTGNFWDTELSYIMFDEDTFFYKGGAWTKTANATIAAEGVSKYYVFDGDEVTEVEAVAQLQNVMGKRLINEDMF